MVRREFGAGAFPALRCAGIVKHYKLRNDEFFPEYNRLKLPPLDLAFIDGSHAFEDVKYDFTNVLAHSRKNTYILLHDTNIYIRELLSHAGVKKWLKCIKRKKNTSKW